MFDTFVKLEECVNNCLLSKLAKSFYEKDFHSQYQIRSDKLEDYFPKLLNLLENIDFRQQIELQSSTLYCLLILYMELKTEGPWNTEIIKTKKYPEKLNQVFKRKYDIVFEEILMKDVFNTQELFDKSVKELHQKMTLDDCKKYPGLIEVYCLLVTNVKEYSITLNPVTVLPVALLLVDDHIVSNKVKGMQCCDLILQCLNLDSFTTGNYYEVVYRSLKRNITEKDTEVTKLLFKCFTDFLNILPPDVQKSKLDDLFTSVLNQLQTESNLYRKAECFKFTTKLIEIHGILSVKKNKMFKDIICVNLDTCCSEGVYEIVTQHVLECLKMWTRYCWCVWKLPSDQKVLSSLIKVLYVSKNESDRAQIQTLVTTLIHLCTKEEQMQIYNNLKSAPICSNNDFTTRINAIKQNICN